jgi:ribonuclease D
MVTATQEIGWIDNSAALARLVAALGEVSIAAVDTEFVREKTYYPQLCLIQIAAGETTRCMSACSMRASRGCCTARGRTSK